MNVFVDKSLNHHLFTFHIRIVNTDFIHIMTILSVTTIFITTSTFLTTIFFLNVFVKFYIRSTFLKLRESIMFLYLWKHLIDNILNFFFNHLSLIYIVNIRKIPEKSKFFVSFFEDNLINIQLFYQLLSENVPTHL